MRRRYNFDDAMQFNLGYLGLYLGALCINYWRSNVK